MSVNDSWATVAAYTYDSTTGGNKGIGRLTSSTSPAASDTITYDLLGRVTTTTRTIDSVNYTTSMTYDSLGRVLSTTLPTGEQVNATYNARGLFESMSGTDTYVSSTAYTPTGGIDSQLLGNAVTTDFTYDSTTNRLSRIWASKIPNNPLIDLAYTYDTGGNITQINDDHDPVTTNREVRTYGYDFLNRLTSADVTVSGSPIDQRDYAYNPIGNMTSFTLNNGTATTYTYPSGSQPITRPHAVSSRDIPNTSNDDSFVYDANGNMTQRVQNGVTWTQTFDAENRLVSVSDGTTTTQYVYDGSGSRVKRIVGNTTTLYVAGMEIEIVSGTETQRTVYYPAGGAFRVIGGANAGLYFRHSDHLGSTSVLSDSTGAKVTGSDVVYAPFGVVRSGTESALTDFGYTGQIHDDDTGGLMFYGARYYLPGVMRFISADTIVPGMFNPQALNRYSYGLNNPVKYSDPTGHNAECAGAGANSQTCNDTPSVCDLIESCVSQLGDYGVTVVGYELATNPLAALQTILSAVQQIGQALYNAGIEVGTDFGSLQEAFTEILGPNHQITIDDGAYEDNCGHGDLDACNTGSLETGANIFLKSSAIDRTDAAALLIHEFGHTFTGACEGDTESCTPQFNGNMNVFDFAGCSYDDEKCSDPLRRQAAQNASLGFLRSGIHLGAIDNDYPYYDSEISADAFANWVLKVNLGEHQSVVNNYMDGIITFCNSLANGCGGYNGSNP